MEDDFSMVVDAFCSQAQDVWPEAADAVATGELEVLERLAHGLKGSALSLGAEQLSDTLEALEIAARQRDAEQSRAHHEAAQTRLTETLDWVAAKMA